MCLIRLIMPRTDSVFACTTCASACHHCCDYIPTRESSGDGAAVACRAHGRVQQALLAEAERPDGLPDSLGLVQGSSAKSDTQVPDISGHIRCARVKGGYPAARSRVGHHLCCRSAQSLSLWGSYRVVIGAEGSLPEVSTTANRRSTPDSS